MTPPQHWRWLPLYCEGLWSRIHTWAINLSNCRTNPGVSGEQLKGSYQVNQDGLPVSGNEIGQPGCQCVEFKGHLPERLGVNPTVRSHKVNRGVAGESALKSGGQVARTCLP